MTALVDDPTHVASGEQPLAGLAVAYVVQRYPKVSHVFIQREVLALRGAGAWVDTYALVRSDPSELLAARDRDEAASTVALRPASFAAVTRAHLRTAIRRPRAYRATLRTAWEASPRGTRARVRQLLYFGQAVLLHDALVRRRARHVHAHLANVGTDVAWLGVDLARRTTGERWTWSFTMHGPTEFHEVDRFNLANKVRGSDAVVCISDFCRSQLMAVVEPEHWSKLRVVHCGVDVDELRVVDRTGRAPRRVLCVGRLVPEKAHAVLLDAVAELRRRGHDADLTLVGDGPEAARLRRRVTDLGLEDHVHLTGALGQDDLAEQLQDADVFCLTSFDEGVPVVLMEAMAVGLPVVATRIAGIPELIDDGANGLLVPPARPDLTADALERLWLDAPLRARVSAAARETVERSFDATREAVALGRLVGSLTRPTVVR